VSTARLVLTVFQPLNPVLGETFFGNWPDVDGRGETTLTVEQVSHHPPVVSMLAGV
jgi:hypothetical protein